MQLPRTHGAPTWVGLDVRDFLGFVPFANEMNKPPKALHPQFGHVNTGRGVGLCPPKHPSIPKVEPSSCLWVAKSQAPTSPAGIEESISANSTGRMNSLSSSPASRRIWPHPGREPGAMLPAERRHPEPAGEAGV